MAGYSRRSLVEKRGIKSATRVVALGAPVGYAMDEVWSGLKFVRRVENRGK
jgi:hypothetical protein